LVRQPRVWVYGPRSAGLTLIDAFVRLIEARWECLSVGQPIGGQMSGRGATQGGGTGWGSAKFDRTPQRSATRCCGADGATHAGRARPMIGVGRLAPRFAVASRIGSWGAALVDDRGGARHDLRGWLGPGTFCVRSVRVRCVGRPLVGVEVCAKCPSVPGGCGVPFRSLRCAWVRGAPGDVVRSSCQGSESFAARHVSTGGGLR
jgi:hypothetical protein